MPFLPAQTLRLTNFQDVIPEFGLSFQKPSSLWPPPSEDMSRRVHASLRTWIRNTFKHSGDSRPATPPPAPMASSASLAVPEPLVASPSTDTGATAPLPTDTERLSLTTPSGEVLTVDQQVHMYTKNSLLGHPLVSGVLGYLGGLPPLLIIASDKEVLRDEIIYTYVPALHASSTKTVCSAHKAADPAKYPIREETAGSWSWMGAPGGDVCTVVVGRNIEFILGDPGAKVVRIH